MPSCASYLCAINVPAQRGVSNTKKKNTCKTGLKKKLSCGRYAVYLLRMWGKKIAQNELSKYQTENEMLVFF